MADKTNEWLEREARESLVATDLSAKMKQWRDQPPPRKGRGNGAALLILLLALLSAGALWWRWPTAEEETPPPPASPIEQPVPPLPPSAPELPAQRQTEPLAQKPVANRYLAIAQANYRAPDFAADIRGDASTGQDALNAARQALANHRPADALDALKNVPGNYQTDAAYLRAHALFGMKQYAQSATAFRHLTGSVRYGEAAQWYEILALLPDFERNKQLIMSRLNQIANDNGHTFQPEAKRLAQIVDKG